ncbi:hypothetical protein P8452_19121 [Trifolium repens]|nr:hypothetical protein P8452_19121 [Trifolium repens]
MFQEQNSLGEQDNSPNELWQFSNHLEQLEITSPYRKLAHDASKSTFHLVKCHSLHPKELEEKRILEEVAEEHMTQLIHRSLVQVSEVGFDGKVKRCQVHDFLREVNIRKMKNLNFCHLIHEDDEEVTVRITRSFSIAGNANNVSKTSNNNSGLRAVFVFDNAELNEQCISSAFSKFKLWKVLDFEKSMLNFVPNNLGNLFHLRYLNLSHTKVKVLPRSIGKLLNLETLDLRQTQVHELPKEINNLTKLRLLPVYYRKYEEADHGGIDLIEELKKLRQLRKLGIRRVRQEYGNALCATIQEMQHLESLNITVIAEEEILDLDFVSTPPPNLKVLNLKCKLTKLPTWIPKLKYLVKLRLGLSNFEHDPLDSLKNLPNLLRLNLWDDAFAGESLHFEVGGFPKLKELDLTRLNKLSSITIEKGALLGLDHFRFNNNPQLKDQDFMTMSCTLFLLYPMSEISSLQEDALCLFIPSMVCLNHPISYFIELNSSTT